MTQRAGRRPRPARWLPRLGAIALCACGPDSSAIQPTGLDVAELLAATDTAGFSRALEPRELVFPADHGPHPDFRTEWWYLTGNLVADDGRHFGYQVTFFRTALAPEAAGRRSAWATRQVYMAHFAITDTRGERFHSFERFGRGAQELAGAQAEPFRVWLEDWQLAADPTSPDRGEPGLELPPLVLQIHQPAVGLDLRLAARKPLVLHGERGLSRKGTAPGNASFYYSSTRLATRGSVRVGEREFAVRGSSWMDREWSTSVLEPGTVGWDWLSLQLDDGSELMYFRLRRTDGATGTESATLVPAVGAARSLGADQVGLDSGARWTSPATGAVYPADWRLSIPAEGLEVIIEPRLAGQELVHTFVYWEGAVVVSGSRRGQPVTGVGYVELTGYGTGRSPRGAARR